MSRHHFLDITCCRQHSIFWLFRLSDPKTKLIRGFKSQLTTYLNFDKSLSHKSLLILERFKMRLAPNHIFFSTFFPVLKELVLCLHLTRLFPNNNSLTAIRCDMFIREHCFEDLMWYAMFIIYGRILNTQKLQGLTSFQPLWSEVKAKAACWFVAICAHMHVGFPATSLWFVFTAAIHRHPATLGHIKPLLLSLICHLN